MKLYEIANNYREALDSLVNEETGELDENALVILNGITDKLDNKGVAIASFIRNITSDCQAIQNEQARLKKRQQTLVSQREWLKDYLLTNMQACGVKEI